MIVAVSRECKIHRAELQELTADVKDACLSKASFKTREFLIRFENILRYYSALYDLDNRYQEALFDMKLKLYRQIEMATLQTELLKEIKSLSIELKYLSKM